MGNFHRFTDPSYYGAPSLPAGPATVSFEGNNYNRINVVSGGTGAGGSAFADGCKPSGPNTGSYLVSFGEDATSSNANRGMRALAENTDMLDDTLHRDIALPVRTTTVTAGAPVASIGLPAQTFVGNIGGYPIDMLFSVLDSNDREIFDPTSGNKVVVTSISGASIGDGFSAGAVTLNLSPSIPATTQYRVYYGTRGNLATMPQDSLTFIKVRGAEEVSAEVEELFAKFQGPNSAGIPWNATPTTTLYDLAYSGLNERYKRSTTKDASTPHPVAIALNSEGSGGWYQRSVGPGVAGYSAITQIDLIGLLGTNGAQENGLGAMWLAQLSDNITTSGPVNTHRLSLSSGFAFLGGKRTSGSDVGPSTPGLFSFYAGARKAGGTPGTSRTLLNNGDTVSLAGTTITLSGTSVFYVTESGIPKSSYALGYDILVLQIGAETVRVVMTSFSSPTVGTFTLLDGAYFSGVVGATIVEWVRSNYFASDGGANYWGQTTTFGNSLGFKGLMYSAGAIDEPGAIYPAEYVRFFAREDTNGEVAFQWGGYNQSSGISGGFTHLVHGTLYGDGYIEGTGLNINGTTTSYLNTLIGVAPKYDSQVVSMATGAATVDLALGANVIEVDLDGATPTTNVLTLTIQHARDLTVMIRRTATSHVNQIAFVATDGSTTVSSLLDASDALLSPTILSQVGYYFDVYTGKRVGNYLVWSVQRIRST